MKSDKKIRSDKRKMRVRKRVVGTSCRPRLSVKLSGKHVYAQCIDDESGVTLAFLSTLAKEIAVRKLSSNVVGATLLGKAFGEKAAAAGVRSVVFDRGDRKYHGCVKAFADAAREAGLLF